MVGDTSYTHSFAQRFWDFCAIIEPERQSVDISEYLTEMSVATTTNEKKRVETRQKITIK